MKPRLKKIIKGVGEIILLTFIFGILFIAITLLSTGNYRRIPDNAHTETPKIK